MTESQDWVPCVRCGKPSAPHGEHHHRPEWGPVGKGMGGTHDHLERVPLCREHHEAVHLHRFELRVSKDLASTWENGHCVSERALAVNEGQQDTRYWSDEALALAWGQAHERAIPLMAFSCKVAYEFKRRYSWQPKWYEQAAQLIQEQTGRMTHPRTVYDRADLWIAFEGQWENYDLVGNRVAISIARAEDVEAALAFGTRQVDEGKRTRTDIADEVHEKFVKQGRRGEPCECPLVCPYCKEPIGCGAKHRRKGA